MIIVQIVGVLMGLAAIHFSHLYYRRSAFSRREFLGWSTVWIAFIVVTIFPNSVRPVVGYLGLQRAMDLIMLVAFVVLFALTFHTYVLSHRQGQRLEQLIRTLALRDLDSKEDRR